MKTLSALKTLTLTMGLLVMSATSGWGQQTWINENIQGWDSKTYGNHTQVIEVGLSTGTVEMTDCNVSPTGSGVGDLSPGHVRMRDNDPSILELPEVPSVSTVTIGISAEADERSIKLQRKENEEWEDVTIFSNIGTAGELLTYHVNLNTPTSLRLYNPSHTVQIHDIIINVYIDDPKNLEAAARFINGKHKTNLIWDPNDNNNHVLLAFSNDEVFGDEPDTQTTGDEIAGGGEVLYFGNDTNFEHDNLDPGTSYYYKIWSYDGTDYSFGLTTTKATTFVNWTGGGNHGEWTDANNWGIDGVPEAEDAVVLDNSGQTSSYEIILPVGQATTTIQSIEITPAGTKSITLVLPSENKANPGLEITGSGDALVLNDGAIFRNSTGASAGSGFELSGTEAKIRINNGGRYIHNTRRAHASAIVANLSAADGTEMGVFEFDVPGSSNYSLSLTNRTYGSIVLSSEEERTYSGSGVSDLTIRGDFIVSENVTFAPTLTGNILVNGDLDISDGGTFEISHKGKVDVDGTLTNHNTGAKDGAGLIIRSTGEDTGSLIHNTPGVEAIAERYIEQVEDWSASPAVEWHFISSPVANQAISGDWTPSGTNDDYDFYAWQENPELWLNHKENAIGSFTPGAGYLVAYEQTGTKIFSGAMNTGEITYAIAQQGTGWNLLGNPYPSAIDWNNANRDHFADDFVYIYDRTKGGGAGGYKEIDGSSQGAVIPAHQGFFVEAAEGSHQETFSFTNNMRIHGGNFMKNNGLSKDIIKLRFANDEYYDETTMRIREGSAFERDRFDARKLFSFADHAPQIYSKTTDQVKAAINSIPEITEETTFPIGMRIPEDGEYSLSLQEVSGAFESSTLLLEDAQKDIVHDLHEQPVYAFEAEEGDISGRFTLHFSPPDDDDNTTDISDADASKARIWHHNNTLFVDNPNDQTEIRLYDISGRLMQTINAGTGQQSYELSLPAGAYIIQSNHQDIRPMKIIIH